MTVTITRKLNRNKYIYNIIGNIDCCLYSNFTFGLLLRKIYLEDKSNGMKYILKQTNYLLKTITWIPIFWLFPIGLFPRFLLFENDNCIGNTKVSFFTAKRTIVIQNHLYELYLHSNNYVSIMKDDRQIALIKKRNIVCMEENHYTVDIDKGLENNIYLMLLLIAFVDIIYFRNRYRWDFFKYEKTVGLDKMQKRTLWKSSDE